MIRLQLLLAIGILLTGPLCLAQSSGSGDSSALSYEIVPRWRYYKSNENIREQRAQDNQRIIPESEKFAALVDGALFKAGIPDDIYHGNGYWLDTRLEAAPSKSLTANLKLIALNGASSYGYARGGYLRPILGVTYDTQWIEKWVIRVRASDLGRQRLGAGLLLEEEEINGGSLEVSHDIWRLLFRAGGTGIYQIGNDTLLSQFDLWDHALGIYNFFSLNESTAPTAKPGPASGIYSILNLGSGFVARAEFSVKENHTAQLAGVGHSWVGQRVGWNLMYQFRRYELGFADGWFGHMEHDYVGWDTQDKDFVNAKNVFIMGDGLDIHSGRVDFCWRPWSPVAFFTENEFGVMSFYAGERKSFYFTKTGFRIYPDKTRNEALHLFATNRIYTYGQEAIGAAGVRTYDPLEGYRVRPAPLAGPISAGMEATFRF